MTRNDAIKHACETVALAYHSIGDYTEPSDGFCRDCNPSDKPASSYLNSGNALRYVRDAVVEKLRRDGFVIEDGFDSDTGDPIENNDPQETP